MSMVTVPVPVGARGIDSEPWSHNADAPHAHALYASGVELVFLYLGAVTAASIANVLAAGLGFVPVTYASAIDAPGAGATTVAQLHALGIPHGCCVFLDIEGAGTLADPAGLIMRVNAWCDVVASAGYVPGVYIGSPQPLTTEELTGLHAVRYWRAPARVVDRHGALAEPAAGWCAYQAWPSRDWAGVWVDVDFCFQDFKGRTIMMCATDPARATTDPAPPAPETPETD
jgi:hypothetical protein